MGVLAAALGSDGWDDRSAFGDFWYTSASRISPLGPVSADSAMTIPQFYAAVTYVSEDMAKLPLNILEDLGEKGSRPARDHELQDLLHYQPNQRQTKLEWAEMVTAWSMLRGRAVSELIHAAPISVPGAPTRRSRGLDQIVPLHPDLVREERTASGWVYKYRDPKKNGAERTLLPDEVFVVRGRQSRSVLDFAEENLRTTLAMERYASFLFSRGARHQGVISAKGRLPDPVRTSLRKAIDEYAIDGPRAGRPLLLEDGMEWKDVSMTPQQAQLFEGRSVTIADACRWIRIPPHKVFDLSRSTNNNIESQGTDYVVDCLLAWSVRWEQAIWRDLIVDKRFFAKILLDALLRGDQEARSRAYALAVMWGWMTRAEVREKEGFNPIAGLELPLTPTNMTTKPDGETSVAYPAQQLLGDGRADSTAIAGQLRLLASDAAGRVVRREIGAVAKLAERSAGDAAAFKVGLEALYAEHAETVARDLHIPRHEALRYAGEQRAALLGDGPAAMEDWLTERTAHLTELAMNQPELERAA